MKKTLLFVAFCFSISFLSAQDKNIGFEITSGNSMMDYGYWKTGTFYPGDFVLAYYDKPLNEIPADFPGTEVIFYFEVKEKGQIVHRHAFTMQCPELPRWKFNLIPDPNDNVSIVFRHDWNGNFARMLAALPKGEHVFEVSTYFEKAGKRVATGLGEVLYDNNDDKGVDLVKMGNDIDKNSTFDPEKEMAEWIEKNGGREAWRKANEEDMRKSDAEDAAREAKDYYKLTAKNNCGDSYTLTVNDAQTYIIDGRGTVEIKIRRGTKGTIKRNGTLVATVSEAQEGSVVSICN